VTCTVDSGLSFSKEATTVLLIVLDEDDNAPTAQTNKHFLNGSELKEVSCVFLVDFSEIVIRYKPRNIYVALHKRGTLKDIVITSYFVTQIIQY